MRKAFTLIEIIIVIIIVGILAAVGLSQYSKTVEKSRGVEARQILGQMRKLAYEYYLTNGTVTGISNGDLGIGTASGQIPGPYTCQSTHYFRYWINISDGGQGAWLCAKRCTESGKDPQGTSDGPESSLYLYSNFNLGTDQWYDGAYTNPLY